MDSILRSHCAMITSADGETAKEQLSHLLNVGIPAERGASESASHLSRAKLQHQLIGAENGIRKLSIALETITSLHNHILDLEKKAENDSKERLQLRANANAMDQSFSDMGDASRRTVKRMDFLLGSIREKALSQGISLEKLGLSDRGGDGENWFERLSILDPLDELMRELIDEDDSKNGVKSIAEDRWNNYAVNLEPGLHDDEFYDRCPFN